MAVKDVLGEVNRAIDATEQGYLHLEDAGIHHQRGRQATLAHDPREPLAGITGLAEFISVVETEVSGARAAAALGAEQFQNASDMMTAISDSGVPVTVANYLSNAASFTTNRFEVVYGEIDKKLARIRELAAAIGECVTDISVAFEQADDQVVRGGSGLASAGEHEAKVYRFVLGGGEHPDAGAQRPFPA